MAIALPTVKPNWLPKVDKKVKLIAFKIIRLHFSDRIRKTASESVGQVNQSVRP